MILINTWAPGESAVMREVPGFKPPAAPAGLVSEHDLKKKKDSYFTFDPGEMDSVCFC